MSSIWFTADEHHGHNNIRRLAGRPFDSDAEMSQALIDQHNDVVDVNDRVYHLGDFCFNRCDPALPQSILSQLNGQHFLVKGNHDYTSKWDPVEFQNTYDSKVLYVRNVMSPIRDKRGNTRCVTVHMTHYPLRDWHARYHGCFHAHGHVHGDVNPLTCPLVPGSLDVGVDRAAVLLGAYRPFHLDEFVKFASTGFEDWLDAVRSRSV